MTEYTHDDRQNTLIHEKVHMQMSIVHCQIIYTQFPLSIKTLNITVSKLGNL